MPLAQLGVAACAPHGAPGAPCAPGPSTAAGIGKTGSHTMDSAGKPGISNAAGAGEPVPPAAAGAGRPGLSAAAGAGTPGPCAAACAGRPGFSPPANARTPGPSAAAGVKELLPASGPGCPRATRAPPWAHRPPCAAVGALRGPARFAAPPRAPIVRSLACGLACRQQSAQLVAHCIHCMHALPA